MEGMLLPLREVRMHPSAPMDLEEWPATLAPIDRARLQDWRDEWDAHARPLPDRTARD